MVFDVNITTKCSLIDMLCPHTCRGCGYIGDAFCRCCKNDIIFGHTNYCTFCKQPICHNVCDYCFNVPTFMIGWRDEPIGKLVHDFKYNSTRALCEVFAELLDSCLPIFADNVVIVPLPTINRHVRERGFDHILLIARRLAKRRGWRVEQILGRNKDYVQVGANKQARILQAVEAYKIVRPIDTTKTYMLLDDVWTTGSSMKAAIKMLQRAGASKVVATVLAVNRSHKK